MDKNARFREMVAMNTFTGDIHAPESTFYENIKATGAVEINENLSISSSLNQELYKKRESQIMSAIADGSIPEYLANKFRKGDTYEFDYFAHYLKNEMNMDVMTDDEIAKNVELSLAAQREEAAEVLSRASFGGKIGAGIGMVGPHALDPIYLPLYFTGVGGAARGTALLTQLGRIAAMEAGTEAVKQVIVSNHKYNINSEYSAKDAITAIAGAAIGSVGFEVTGRLLGAGLRKLAKTDLGVYGSHASEADIAFARSEVNSFADLLEKAPDPEASAIKIVEDFNANAKRLDRVQLGSELRETLEDMGDMPTETKALQAEVESNLASDPDLMHYRKDVDATGTEVDTVIPMKEEYARVKETQTQIDEAIKCFSGAA